MRSVLLTAAAVSLFGTASAQNLVFITNDAATYDVIPSSAGTDVSDPSDTTNSQHVEVFDIDNDGNADVFFLNHNGNHAGYLGDGGTPVTFAADTATTDVLYTSGAGRGSKGMCVLDWEGDGDQDVFIATGPVGGFQQTDLWLENGSSGTTSFTNVTGNSGFPATTDHSYDAAVMTRNGFAAIVTASRVIGGAPGSDSGENRVFQGNGAGVFTQLGAADGTFTTENAMEVLSTRALAVADMDNDGDDDIVVATAGNGTQPNRLVLQGPVGELPISTPFGSNEQSYGVDVADLDADGLPEVLFANRQTATNGVVNSFYENDGMGLFSDITTTGLTVNTDASYDVCFADLDEDGDLDVIVSNNIDDNRVIRNVDGQGPFVPAGWEPITDGLLQDNEGRSRAVACSDFGDYGYDNDARHNGLEVIFANTKPTTGTEGRPNEFYRGVGVQCVDLLGASSTANATPQIDVDGFFAPSVAGTGGEINVTNGRPSSLSSLVLDTVSTGGVAYPGGSTQGGGTTWADAGSGTAISTAFFNLNGLGEATPLVVGSADIPAALAGVQLFLQLISFDPLVLPSSVGISNGLSIVVQ